MTYEEQREVIKKLEVRIAELEQELRDAKQELASAPWNQNLKERR